MPSDVIVFDLLQEMFNREKKPYIIQFEGILFNKLKYHNTLSSMHVTEFFSTDSKNGQLLHV